MIKINEKLKEKLDNLPQKPGIYKFFDIDGRVVYVGKSKCLRKRVKSYFVDNPKWDKVNRMKPFIQDIEIQTTDTHLEARLLECMLIKSIKPIFNTQMKDDGKYAYIKIQDFNSYNPLKVVYIREENSFGPFRRNFALYKLINLLRNLYPITRINGDYSFNYNLFPATLDRQSFETNRNILLEIFSDDINLAAFTNILEFKMMEASSAYRFETASMYRDIVENLNYLKSGINGYKNMFSKNILLKIKVDNGYKLFFISKGQIVSKKLYKRITKISIDKFITTGQESSKYIENLSSDKGSIDFRDIIYSEIGSLPKDMMIILE
ncbi:GIY-YIG nuclease family protein [Tissierella sp. Yu-01]|uniref:GIY-YIG nuclease family protein n=1 Tax=Tissierella sp. Yu-01 TaxID=3035694 RepID=UPI00240E50EA|nr:GIY-YIG nuclease family protein [Tissierella sp. Yu-01]WFA07693.1 GIY-YIG nuclease family protein [Tissierella sp. Yu-01]